MKHAALGAVVVVAGIAGIATAGEIDATLQDILDRSPPDKVHSTLVYLNQQVDLRGLSNVLDANHARLRDRHEAVVMALRDVADQQQPALLQHLDALRADGRVQDMQAFWIVNAVQVSATPAEITLLAQRPEVERIYHNPKVTTIKPVAESPAGGEGGVASLVPEPGVTAVRAPEVWALGITGNGVLVSSLDTGVAGTHPALASRWKGLEPSYAGHPEWAWFDPVPPGTSFPTAFGDHGTHTMGTVCGGAPGNQIGVAPGAKWIHAAVIDRVSIGQTISDAILAFQWLVDPDGNPNTFVDVPAACSNSWGLADFHGVPDCDQTFWTFLDACEAAGVVILFSAGNEGTGGLRRPADRATDAYRTLAVAAVNGNVPSFPIASFSSQGPTVCTLFGGSAIKPDISAPGVGVVSAVPGGYGSKDGTSMASPHVNGVVALMREANPDLGVEQIKQIIYDTAQDLGAASEDNAYGWGMIDAFDAVQEALGTVALTITLPNGTPVFVDPLGGTIIDVVASGQSVDPAPGTGMLHYSTGGPYVAIPMNEGALGVYEAVFPAFDCGAHVTYYFSVQAETGETVVKPPSAPDVTYASDAYSGTEVSFTDNFETNLGWTVTNGPTLTTGMWQRGDPVGGGDRGDPASDFDGSGQCFVTHNVDGDFDVDNGSTTVTSPIMDATLIADPVLSYARWYSNNFGASPFQDTMLVEISDNGGTSWSTLEIVGPQNDAAGGWVVAEFLISDHVNVTNALRIRVTASDVDPQSVVEAGIDDVKISALVCEEPACPADVNGDGVVNVVDLVEVVLNPGPCNCANDINDDGVVDVQDLVLVILGWGPCE